MLSLLPVFGILVFNSICQGMIPHLGLDPNLLSAATGLITMQVVYLLCWDFDFFRRRPRVKPQDEGVRDMKY